MNPIIVNIIANDIQRHDLNLDRRHLRDASNPFDLPSGTFIQIYRLTKEMAQSLFQEIEPSMREGRRNTSIPKHIRMFTCLQFMDQGSYQKCVGQDFLTTMSQSSVSRCLTEVTDIIVEQLGNLNVSNIMLKTTVAKKLAVRDNIALLTTFF